MNKILLGLGVLAVLAFTTFSQQTTTCPIFQCSPYSLGNFSNGQQICSLNTIGTTNKNQHYVYLQTCNPNNMTCVYDFDKEPTYTQTPCKPAAVPPPALKAPGWRCGSSSECYSGNCNPLDQLCVGGVAGSTCVVDLDCGMNLYCATPGQGQTGVCSQVLFELEECSNAPHSPLCQWGTVCSTGLCKRIQSLPVGELAEGPEGFAACQSLTTYGNKCSAPYTLYSQKVWNQTGSDCLYHRAGVSLAPAYPITSKCGYSSTGMSYCPDGVGDHADLLNYTATAFFANRPVCHISEPVLTVCDYAVIYGNITYTKEIQLAQLFFQNYTNVFESQQIYIDLTVAIQDNDPCTQNLITFPYWNVQNSSATHLIAGLISLVIVSMFALI